MFGCGVSGSDPSRSFCVLRMTNGAEQGRRCIPEQHRHFCWFCRPVLGVVQRQLDAVTGDRELPLRNQQETAAT